MKYLIALILINVTSFSVMADSSKHWGGDGWVSRDLISEVKSFKPNFDSSVNQSLSNAYYNIRKSLYSCMKTTNLVSGELFIEHNEAQITYYASLGDLGLVIIVLFELTATDAEKTNIVAWGGDNVFTFPGFYIAEKTRLMVDFGKEINCKDLAPERVETEVPPL